MTETVLTKPYFQALHEEIKQRANFLAGESIETIYLGGGTPSLVEPAYLENLFMLLVEMFDIQEDAEITLEMNPDDVNARYLDFLKCTPVNRISLGVQSFDDKDLTLMNRRHDSGEAINSINSLIKSGFENLGIDLIYGLPYSDKDKWQKNLDKAFSFPVKHLSAYHLTYEEGTNFYQWLKKGNLNEVEDEQSLEQYQLLVETAVEQGFIHYEISNFGKENHFSRHNTSYWQGKKYLGAGPSAHSFDETTRRWNTSNLQQYMHGIKNGGKYWDEEVLTESDKYNEYLITRLRTIWGVNKREIELLFDENFYSFFEKTSMKMVKRGLVSTRDEVVYIPPSQWFIADSIIENFVLVR